MNLGRENLAVASGPRAAEVIQWDVRSLPLRDATVDAIVVDLPFGKRVGSRAENKTLYPALLREVCAVSNLLVVSNSVGKAGGQGSEGGWWNFQPLFDPA